MSGNQQPRWDPVAEKWFLLQPHNGFWWKVFNDRTSEPLINPHTNAPIPVHDTEVPRTVNPQTTPRTPQLSHHQSPSGGLYAPSSSRGGGLVSALASTALPTQPLPDLGGRTIRGQPNSSNREDLDPSYRLRKHPETFFVPGKVLSMLWPEVMGSTANTNITQHSLVVMGQRIHAKIRRFVVIRPFDQHCLAVPIHTYDGRGLSKPNLKKSDHGIIYTGDQPPAPNEHDRSTAVNEAPIRKFPVRVIPKNDSDKLDPKSRINYGKVYTIEFNVKVKDYGDVDPADLRNALILQWAQVLGLS